MEALNIEILPQNAEKVQRLLAFLEEVLVVTEGLGLQPVLDGSLAVFLYTKNQNLIVNDVDLSLLEKHFPELEKALKTEGIDAEIKEWHVLQARRGDLKVEFGDTDYWYPDIPIEAGESLQVGSHKLGVLKLPSLISFYALGIKNLANDTSKQDKLNDLKEKYQLLLAARS